MITVRAQPARPASPAALRPSAQFSLAAPSDDPAIRRLLRENPTPGRISLSLEREPDASLAASVEGDPHHTLLARDPATGEPIALGSVSVRTRFLNGAPARVGYLGQLRLDRRHRPRGPLIRAGYEFFRELHETLGTKLYLTSIAADNNAARRLLERGLPGMPTYRKVAELVTLVLRRRPNGDIHKPTAFVRRSLRRQRLELRHGHPDLLPLVADCANRLNAAYQFAPIWSPDELAEPCNAPHALQYANRRSPTSPEWPEDKSPSLYPKPSHYRLVLDHGRPIACGAVWDQRSFKQSVVRAYPPHWRRWRIAINLLAPFTRMPHLPRIGQPVQSAFLSHLATPHDRPELIEPLIRALHGSAASLRIDSLVVAFDARDPRLPIVRRLFGGAEYRTHLYAVHWDDGRALAESLDDRLCQPEVALL